MSARTSADTASAIVVGAGAFGSAAADALARRGWAVTVVEQYAPANARGSSGDRTRQLRRGHGAGSEEEDLWYIRSAEQGISMWQELSDAQRPVLIEPTGMVWLAHDEDGIEQRTHERLDLAGVPNELLTPAQTQALFPGIAVDDLALAVFEPGAGVIRAQEAVLALLRRATSFGAQLLPGRARPSGPGTVVLTDGSCHSADRVVWACGAWLGRLFPHDAPVRASWQDVIHWQTPPGWEHTPTWFDGDAFAYGFPDIDGLGIKAVSHLPGASFDIDRDGRLPNAEAVRKLAAYVAHRFPPLTGVQPLWARVMAYEMTPDEHFIVGRCSDAERHWLLGGGSGHGFKHAPALGELLADAIEGKRKPPAMLAPGPRPAIIER